ncbi:hypothetical protein V2H45_14855 [Tumidithrix elongata RA019]|uniref:Carrier domain-containing protein n=1 Tax=Tumidithrix elongata BACA0141 TaxID=2716417 RepID=A0AAW9Q570_9CYAN|nr:hypothetical protein [Tumidithrix elongata RA019]
MERHFQEAIALENSKLATCLSVEILSQTGITHPNWYMTNANELSIEEIVKKLAEDLSDIPFEAIKLSDRLIKDLKIDGDDLSFVFIPELELKLSLKVPTQEWSKVYTIEDVINLLQKHTQ